MESGMDGGRRCCGTESGPRGVFFLSGSGPQMGHRRDKYLLPQDAPGQPESGGDFGAAPLTRGSARARTGAVTGSVSGGGASRPNAAGGCPKDLTPGAPPIKP